MSTKLTMQQIFSAAYLQSLKKEKSQYTAREATPSQSATFGSCLYKNSKGKKCFIGASIPDELYAPGLEHRSGGPVLISLGLLPRRDFDKMTKEELDTFNDTDMMIIRLQKIHDSVPVEHWEANMLKLAVDYHLQIPTAPLPDSNSMTVQL
jgi:hypothetical protein